MRDGPLDMLLQKLSRYPQVRHTPVNGGCEIEAPNVGGFKIGFYPDGAGWVVSFGEGGMHERFMEPADALDFVAFGLSVHCRLRETIAPFLRRSIVERRDDERWTAIYEVGRFWWPVPLGPRERVLQNTLIKD